jgi:hypothetical protein
MLAELNCDLYDFMPAEVAIHSAGEYGALVRALGPSYLRLARDIGRCPPDVRIVPVVVDPAVHSGLAHVRSGAPMRTSTIALF